MTEAPRHWLFDLGNTRLKLAPLGPGGRAGEPAAHAHAGSAEALARLPLPRGASCTVASVAPAPLATALVAALTQRFTRIACVRVQARFGGLSIGYGTPAHLGVDRFLALLGAQSSAHGAVLVVGVGTALTIDLVDAGGVHRGGRIAPSPTLMREALQARSARLPAAGGAYAEFAGDTADALASGCTGAAIALVERSHAKATALLGAAPRLLLHGGGAHALLPLLPRQAMHRPALVMDGLARWATRVDAGR